MLRFFVHHVIAGKTGKRESAWFVFTLFAVWTGFMVWAEFAHERELTQASSMWMVVAPFVMGWVMAAHGLEWREQTTRRAAAADALNAALAPLPDEQPPTPNRETAG